MSQEFEDSSLVDRLDSIDRNTAAASITLQTLSKDLGVLSKLVTGNGDHKAGLLHRVDTLEFGTALRGRMFWVVMGAAAVAGMTYLIELI